MIEGSTLWAVGLLTVVPFALMATTSFVKLHFVFSILRNALGDSAGVLGAALLAASHWK